MGAILLGMPPTVVEMIVSGVPDPHADAPAHLRHNTIDTLHPLPDPRDTDTAYIVALAANRGARSPHVPPTRLAHGLVVPDWPLDVVEPVKCEA